MTCVSSGAIIIRRTGKNPVCGIGIGISATRVSPTACGGEADCAPVVAVISDVAVVAVVAAGVVADADGATVVGVGTCSFRF